MLQGRQHGPYLSLVLGHTMQLFGRGSLPQKPEEPVILVPALLPPEFIDAFSNACAVKPSGGIDMMRFRSSHEFPEHVHRKFFGTAGIIDNACDHPGNPGILQVEQLRQVRVPGRGDDPSNRMAFRVHTNKTTSLSIM